MAVSSLSGYLRRLETLAGKGTTFYSWLDVPSTATTAEISKAYRKKSIQLQYVNLFRSSDKYSTYAHTNVFFDVAVSPDKNPGVAGIHERFARLGVIAAILRGSESRKR